MPVRKSRRFWRYGFRTIRRAMDGEGPVVYGVQLVVNGEVRPDLVPVVVRRDLTNQFTVVGKTDFEGNFLPSFYYEPGIKTTPGPYFGLETPLFADALYRRDYARGEDVADKTDLDRLLKLVEWMDPSQVNRADGTEGLVYYFDLEGITHVRSVEVEASVGNDYRIEIADLSVSNPREGTPYEDRYISPFYRTVRRAEGNVQDLSNVERIRIPIGSETGQSVWSVNMALDLPGLRVRGEFAESFKYSRYPDGTPGGQLPLVRGLPARREGNGAGHRARDRAGYVQLERETARYAFGGELFSIGPMFNQRMTLKPGDDVIGYDFFQKNKTTFINLLEDNDDKDNNPETKIWGVVPPDLSVFPGQDADNDGIPDTNVNLNNLPDYLEPFLLYRVDPDEYVYGLDFNNNDVVDEREDDQEVDLPYDRDLQGGHGYVRWQAWTGADATVGWLESDQIAGGGRNDQRYLRVRYSGERPGVGEWMIENELKRVWDDVPDDVYSWTASVTNVGALKYGLTTEIGRFSYRPTYVPDPLNYRNSLVNRVYISGILKWLPGWRIVTRVKLERNRQYAGRLGDGSEQARDRVRSLAWVQQADYTWRSGALRLQPALKGLWLKRSRQRTGLASVYTRTVVPLVTARYELSPATELKAGFQGVPGWWFEETDLAEPRDSFERRTMTVVLSNMSHYSGYRISANLGITQDKVAFKDEFRFLENYDTTSIFVRLFLGYAQSVLY